jgi:hypothetical protein
VPNRRPCAAGAPGKPSSLLTYAHQIAAL